MQDKTDGSTRGPLTCAGCEHPIQEGDNVVLKIAVEGEQTNESNSKRVSWRDRLSKALLFYQGLEQLFGSIPQSLRDLCGRNGETIRHIAGGTATFLLLAGKRGVILLKSVPHAGPIAGGVFAVVVVGVVMAGSIQALDGRKRASKDNQEVVYFHIKCSECRDGQSCCLDFTGV